MARELIELKKAEPEYRYYFVNGTYGLTSNNNKPIKKDSVLDMILQRFIRDKSPVVAKKLMIELKRSTFVYDGLMMLKASGILGLKNNKYYPIREVKEVMKDIYYAEI